jgi:hypothetical protein
MEGVTTVRRTDCTPFGGPAAGIYRLGQDQSVRGAVGAYSAGSLGAQTASAASAMPATKTPVRTWGLSHDHKENPLRPLDSREGWKTP